MNSEFVWIRKPGESDAAFQERYTSLIRKYNGRIGINSRPISVFFQTDSRLGPVHGFLHFEPSGEAFEREPVQVVELLLTTSGRAYFKQLQRRVSPTLKVV